MFRKTDASFLVDTSNLIIYTFFNNTTLLCGLRRTRYYPSVHARNSQSHTVGRKMAFLAGIRSRGRHLHIQYGESGKTFAIISSASVCTHDNDDDTRLRIYIFLCLLHGQTHANSAR